MRYYMFSSYFIGRQNANNWTDGANYSYSFIFIALSAINFGTLECKWELK